MAGSLRLIAGAVAGVALLAGANPATAEATSAHGTPIVEAAPSHAPKMKIVRGAGGTTCTVRTPRGDPSTAKDEPLMWMRAHPAELIAIWIPGLNTKPKHCVARRTTNGAGLAKRVAAAIRHAKAFPDAPMPCPFDDGISVRLYLTYRSGGDEYADVSLGGCRPISAPGRASRWGDTSAIEKALRKAAPPRWRSYLAG